jgi:uncharacterized membrane protein
VLPRLFDHRIEFGVSDDFQSLLKQPASSRLFAVRDAEFDSAVKAKVISGQFLPGLTHDKTLCIIAFHRFRREGERVSFIRQRKPLSIVYGATAAYVVVFFTLSAMQHASFHTGYDLGGAMQGLWALAFGESQFNTFWGTHNWLNHAYVLSLPVALVYRFVPSAYFLLLLQTVALASSAPVVYHLAREKTNDERLSVALALCYLGYPVLHFANLFDFHWDVFQPLFLLLMLYYADKSLPRLLLCAALALACKEDAAFTLCAMGIYVALSTNRWGGVATCALSILWFFAVVSVLVPTLSGGRSTPHLAYWSAYGETPAQVARFAFTHPLQTLRIVLVEHGGLKYIFKVNLCLLFLPLLAPEVLLMALPFFVMRFLSTFEPHHNVYFHFSLTETPIVFYAAIIGARRLRQFQQRRMNLPSSLIPHPSSVSLSAALLVCLLLTSALLGPFRGRGQYQSVFSRFAFTERSRVLREICRQIPPHAVLSVSYALTPHLAHRRFVYMFPNPYRRSHWNGRPGDPDYGKFTVSDEPEAHLERGRDVEWIIVEKNAPKHKDILTELKRSGEFAVVRDDRFALVLRRSRPPQPELHSKGKHRPQGFRDATQGEELRLPADTGIMVDAHFGELITCVLNFLRHLRADEAEVAL